MADHQGADIDDDDADTAMVRLGNTISIHPFHVCLDSRVILLESPVPIHHFGRFRSQWRSLFGNHRSTSQPNESVPPMLLSTRSPADESRELPPPYPPAPLPSIRTDNHSNPSVGLPTTTSCIRQIPKRQIVPSSSSSAIATTEENQRASTDDDENKLSIH